LGIAERRNEIMKILSRRRYETVANLASELGVSPRTIRRDIEMISLVKPIYTQTGRYGGGIYVMENFFADRMYMTDKEIAVLSKIYEIVTKSKEGLITVEEKKLLERIIRDYSKSDIQERKKYDKK